MKVRDVAIVGAGMSGLVAAANLAAYGLDVVVLEKSVAPGGKLEPVRIGEAMLDAGPTVLTLRGVLDEVLAEIGVATDDHLTLRPLDVLARHAWQESEWLDLYADRGRTADAIGKFSGAASARAYLEFCRDSAALYGILEGSFIRSPVPTLWNLVAGVGSLRDLMRIKPFKSLWSELGRYFLDPRLRQLFARYATYCGSSPFEAPATLMLIAHVEQAGVWRVEGGMHRIGRALADVARLKGADVRLASAVESIECQKGVVAGVRLSSGERIAARCVLSTVDAAAIRGGLLGSDVARAVRSGAVAPRSLSALTWTMRAMVSGPDLSHHNVFFSADYAREFADIAGGWLPEAPTVYVCAPDRSELIAAGRERLLCIVNAPALEDGRSEDSGEVLRCQEETFRRIRSCGIEMEFSAEATMRRTPEDYRRMFPGTGGAIYGTAQHGWRAAFRRPVVTTRIPGLFLAGGSIHPGPGLPIADSGEVGRVF